MSVSNLVSVPAKLMDRMRGHLGIAGLELHPVSGVSGRYILVETARAQNRAQNRAEDSQATTAPTEREMQILRGIARGLENREIGACLHLTEDTVKSHARRLFHKLGARSRAHAVALAYQRGILGGDPS